MKLKHLALALLAGSALTVARAEAGTGNTVPALNHVFLIMMENHGYQQIIGNPYAPFVNQEAASAHLATNYFAVAHPSLTNYLEVVGGSNFGVQDDNSPDWHNANCQPNIASGIDNDESNPNPVCPIAGTGTDAATPAIDYTNETNGPPGVLNVDGVVSYGPAPTTAATIADQLTAVGKTWKSYQESLPESGADNVNNADGFFSNLSTFTSDEQALGENNGAIVALYAVKHNPFAYFASVQNGGLGNIVGFPSLFGDLASGNVPTFSFIAPNQCHDQHGKSSVSPFCNYDPNDNGTQVGLNPALINMGDQALQQIVTSIKASPIWTKGKNAIVIVWDESDYSIAPINNQVVTIVDTNYSKRALTSNRFYTHFNLLNTIETAFGLPCLNHACDDSAFVMGDLFSK